MPAESPRALRRDFASPFLLGIALIIVALWPGDVSWLMDEPRLIASAWHANHDVHLAIGGLYGNFGIRYGPLPTQIYQLLLLFTHDPFALVVLRSLLCAGACGVGFLWLGRSTGLPAWFAIGALLSPYVVAYHRVLWDASFAMPVGVLALAGFADFLQTSRAWSLRLAVLAGILAPTIHPQALPLSASILGWLAWQHRPALWKDRRALALLGLLILIFNGYYLVQFAGQLCLRLSGSVQKGYPGTSSHALSTLAPLLGGHLLVGADYLEKLAPSDAPATFHRIAAAAAWIFYPLAWVGVLVAAKQLWPILRTQKIASATLHLSPRQTLACVVLLGLIFQALLFGLMRIPAAPQYFFGTFALQVVIAWIAVDALRAWKLGVVLGTLYTLGSLLLTVEATWSIHQHGYERPRWPTLASSVNVTRTLNRYADSTALTNVAVYEKSPQALRTLRLLLPPTGANLPNTHGHLFITHSSVAKPAETTVIVLDQTAPPPSGLPSIDTTPLPKDWVPDPATW
ncbi:MAG TPA: hypothetical protein VGM54_17580 [Chthoniobacter sp.]|jgi:hypothetical protein